MSSQNMFGWYLWQFWGLVWPVLLFALPFVIWMVAMIVARRKTSMEQESKRKTYKILAIVAGCVAATIVVVWVVFCALLTVAVAHM